MKNFLFCEKLKTANKAENVFQFAKDFFAKHELDIQCIGTYALIADGALAFLGNKTGVSALIKQKIPHLQGSHVSVFVMPWHKKTGLGAEILKSICEGLRSECPIFLFRICSFVGEF